MGEVWLAEHAMLGRRAAIKVLRAEYSSRAEIVTRFFNEARAATAIADPGIVQIFDFGHHSDGSAYIVMELLDGEPLDKRLARHGRLPVPDALRIMRQVASSLGAAHARGIVHRDLKPENIFLVRDPEVSGGERAKLLDFGIAKLAGDSAGVKTQTAAMMGTPTYMSPEQCRGAGQVDQRSDVYSLGCVLFALVVGRPVFDAEGVGEIIAMHLREPAPRASARATDISPAVDALIARCLEKDPDQRFTSGAELASAIDALLGRTSGAQPAPAVASAAIPPSAVSVPAAATTLSTAAGASVQIASPKRSRAGLIAGVGVVAAIGAVTAVVATRDNSGDERTSSPPQIATAPVVAKTDTVAPQAAPPPPPASPKADDPFVVTTTRISSAARDFVTWSKTHAGAPCPTSKDIIGDASLEDDGWGHAMTITCTDQPADQIVGVISAGSDGQIGTADDVASWQLGRDITDLVHGARWALTPLKQAPATASANKPAATSRPGTVGPGPTATRPAHPKPQKPIEFDANGVPLSR